MANRGCQDAGRVDLSGQLSSRQGYFWQDFIDNAEAEPIRNLQP